MNPIQKINSLFHIQQTKINKANDGLIQIKFNFDGVLYQWRHQLSQDDLKSMKEACRLYGDTASDSVFWRFLISTSSRMCQALIGTAGNSYVEKNYAPPKSTVVENPEYNPDIILDAANETDSK